MREILFRGQRKDNNQWVEGMLSFMFDDKDKAYIMPKCYFATKDFGEEDENGNPKIETDCALGGFIRVIPETVGQFTGLLDKNGKKIFEGDIVKVWHDVDEDDSFWTTGIVEYSPAEFYIIGDGHSITCHFHYNTDDRIIVGNIHDNPKLLTPSQG